MRIPRHPGAILAAAAFVGAIASALALDRPRAAPDGNYALFAVNDLGMHCMQEDYSEFCILPPYNTLRAQLIRRAAMPVIVDSGAVVTYAMPTQQRSTDQSNFWTYAAQLFGSAPAPGVGLAGNRTAGTMQVTPDGIYEAKGVPILASDDDGRIDPYPLAMVVATGPAGRAFAAPVAPVSSEMSCSFCHGAEGGSVAASFLTSHDTLHGTNLMAQRPVLCAQCHADAALGAPGMPGVSNLSAAMHGAHATRVNTLGLSNVCYACHPGVRSQCQRDLHASEGITCVRCHGNMTAMGSALRQPWVDEPRCANCHDGEGGEGGEDGGGSGRWEFEQPGKLFKDSVGHGGVRCTSCHGPPHAMVQSTNQRDNLLISRLAGEAGPIERCTTCHTTRPAGDFFHRVTR